MAEERGATETGNRTDAASMIAELWAEREQSRSRPSEAGPNPKSPPPAAPRPKASGRERALAAGIAVLLVGGALGVAAITLGIIGAPSKAAFLAEADAICASANGGVNAISKPTGFPTVASTASTLVTTTDTQLGQLRALELPGGTDRGRAKGVWRAMSATSDAGRTLQMAAAASDAAMTGLASRSMTIYSQDAAVKARQYGFGACVVGMQPGIDAVVAGANGAVKDSFVEKGNALCVGFVKALDAAPKLRNNDIVTFVNQNTALMDKLVVDLKALPVPPGDEATVADMLGTTSNLIGKLRLLGPAAAAGDVRRVNEIEKEGDVLEDAVDAKFGAYGLHVCGSPA